MRMNTVRDETTMRVNQIDANVVSERQVRRARDKNARLLQRMNEIVDKALSISGLDEEYDAVCRQVTNTLGAR
jgi:uncharacterized protein YigA (DUF484 family)